MTLAPLSPFQLCYPQPSSDAPGISDLKPQLFFHRFTGALHSPALFREGRRRAGLCSRDGDSLTEGRREHTPSSVWGTAPSDYDSRLQHRRGGGQKHHHTAPQGRPAGRQRWCCDLSGEKQPLGLAAKCRQWDRICKSPEKGQLLLHQTLASLPTKLYAFLSVPENLPETQF